MTGLTAAACASVLLIPAPAAAAQPPRATTGPHCVATLATGTTACYTTFRESIAAATGGRITNAPITPAEAATDKKFQARLNTAAPRSTTAGTLAVGVGAVLFEDASYQGYSLTLSLHHGGDNGDYCKNDADWDGSGNLSSHGFDNTISSVWSYNNCQVKLWAEPNYGGISNLYDRTTWVGSAMNDTASSFAVKAVGEAL
ncbi:hypothetical protein GCM10010387_36490 [Streptomyces inusitatus]|uniref:Uncharacterized protein n=1 Tax=Streptomyces inusitatus TaxID=68221 RepID=A0A918UWK9_9ACTN|nr:hypothetical protein GCM10010387_36490 [Streptomyces inusitatus]